MKDKKFSEVSELGDYAICEYGCSGGDSMINMRAYDRMRQEQGLQKQEQRRQSLEHFLGDIKTILGENFLKLNKKKQKDVLKSIKHKVYNIAENTELARHYSHLVRQQIQPWLHRR